MYRDTKRLRIVVTVKCTTRREIFALLLSYNYFKSDVSPQPPRREVPLYARSPPKNQRLMHPIAKVGYVAWHLVEAWSIPGEDATSTLPSHNTDALLPYTIASACSLYTRSPLISHTIDPWSTQSLRTS